MALPADNSSFPPAEQTDRYSRMATNSIWYGGDPARLTSLYGGDINVSHRSQKNIISRVFDWFWGQSDPTQLDDKVHLPVAQDIAQMSAELLFAESPRFVVQPIIFDDDGNVSDEHRLVVERTQRRLDDLLASMDFESTLLSAAETSAAIGNVGFRIGYDTQGMTKPVISRIDGDAIVPEYRFGQLVALTFWEVLETNGETIIYHLERHEIGQVEHAVYKGVRGNLGTRIPLNTRPEMRGIVETTNNTGIIFTSVGRMNAVSVPNMLPDPLDRKSNSGRSDFSPGVLTQFDAVDKTITSLMRDIKDGRSRLLIADYMLSGKGLGEGVEFDGDQHMFTRLKRQPPDMSEPPIDQVQFKIRVDEHLKTLDYLINRAVKSCGYNTDTEIGEGGGDMTATEYAGRAKKSLATRSKKLRYFGALEALIETLLHVDADVFNSGVTPLPVKMEAASAMQVSEKMLADTVEVMSRSKAASREVLVRTLHPEWSQDMVDEEVDTLLEESGVGDPEIVPGVAGDVLPATDARDDV